MKVKLLGLMTLCMALVIQVSHAQEKTVSGTVTSVSDGLPIPGVNVIVKGTTRGVQTDFDGNYSIRASVGEVLAFSYVGMQTAEAVVGASNTINMGLSIDGALDEVVVVAFGTTTKEAFTGSASVIKAEELELRSLTSPISAIEGNTTGVQFLSASGQPGSSPSIVIRGVGTLNGTTDPLYIVDGISYFLSGRVKHN
ncbi:carboxypeptidase-like regulatory domain-containing protein [Gelidibacter maritimus]|uniref:carboxypeptidase-like regulatory domain-containing protein n=1 Tax=Gelidibacter maritimus TaxID=2761487 RepID=UPI00293BA412|nr:carboxypeptidase-like regulatory domain-containing protein [Gelidibacter maritimus]